MMASKFSLSRYLTEAYTENVFMNAIWHNPFGNPTYSWENFFNAWFTKSGRENVGVILNVSAQI